MVRPPENVLIFPRRERRASKALLRLMLSASTPVRLRRVVVTISERFGKAIAYPLWVRPFVPPGASIQRLGWHPERMHRLCSVLPGRLMGGAWTARRQRLRHVVLSLRWLSPVHRLAWFPQRL